MNIIARRENDWVEDYVKFLVHFVTGQTSSYRISLDKRERERECMISMQTLRTSTYDHRNVCLH